MSGSTFLIHTLKETANWWMNLFLSLFYREQLQKKSHPAPSQGIQVRHANRFIRWWVSLSDIRKISQGFWLGRDRPLLFLERKEKPYYFLLHIPFPVPLMSAWYHSYQMEIIASCCHQMPRKSAKITHRNGNMTNSCISRPHLFFIFYTCVTVAQELRGCCSSLGGQDPSQAVVAAGEKQRNIPHRGRMCGRLVCCCFLFVCLTISIS